MCALWSLGCQSWLCVHLLDARGNLVNKDEEKSEELNACFASVFCSSFAEDLLLQQPIAPTPCKKRLNSLVSYCPGFGQNRINFHWNPGRDTAGRADPHLAKQSRVFHTMCHHAGFRWGVAGRGELSRGSGAQRWEWLSGLCGLCCVFSLSVSLLLLFPLFAVLLNCPYPDPPVSACFFPFCSAPWQGEGWPHGALLPATAKP